jgi:hypothetical protein
VFGCVRLRELRAAGRVEPEPTDGQVGGRMAGGDVAEVEHGRDPTMLDQDISGVGIPCNQSGSRDHCAVATSHSSDETWFGSWTMPISRCCSTRGVRSGKATPRSGSLPVALWTFGEARPEAVEDDRRVMANSMAREFLPATDIPTMVASVREVEHLVGIGQRRPVSGVLSEIIRPDDERRTWELGTALGAFDESADRNPLLDSAWARLPVRRRSTARMSRR